MWEMYEESGDLEVECDSECGVGPPPPVFNLPPPPRPDFMQELSTCSENSPSDYEEMCEAIPILDASSLDPSLQSSAIILLCTVLLIIFIFISSIFIWKHKRKVQNFLPGKNSSARGALDAHHSLAMGGQTMTYEDPRDTLVMRPFPLDMEMLSTKTFHYASSIPMQCSPQLFSSQGPDPYRSNDNVYEELEHPITRHSLNKSSSDNTTVATIYQDNGGPGVSGTYLERNRVERNSLLSSASSSIHGGGGSSNESNNILHNTLGNLRSGDGSNLFHFRTSARRDRRALATSSFESSNSDHIDISGDTNNNKNDQDGGGGGEDSEVERLNRRNAQLSHGSIREHYRPTRANYYAPPQHIIAINNQISARINPQFEARENVINNNNGGSSNTAYDDPYMTSISSAYDESGNAIYHHPYMTTFRSYNNLNNPQQPLYNCTVGSDSGYSQNTQTSDGRSMRGRARKSNRNNNNNNTVSTRSRGIRLPPQQQQPQHHFHQNASNYNGDS